MTQKKENTLATTTPLESGFIRGIISGSLASTNYAISALRTLLNTPAQSFAAKVSFDEAIGATSGILFGTDTAVDNTLDDYEEGTFTATLASGATTTPTLTGHYTKIGNKVTAWLSGSFGTITLNGTPLIISGLPFVANREAYGSIGITARVQIQPTATHFCKIDNTTTIVSYHYMTADTGSALDLLTQAAGIVAPAYGFTLTYKV